MCNQGKLSSRAGTHAQYVVDCSLQQIDGGRALVLPITAGGHVRERVIRCRSCAFCKSHEMGLICAYRPIHHFWTKADDFCSHAKPRGR